MRLNIYLFGGRGASSSIKSAVNKTEKEEYTHIAHFRSNKIYDEARRKGYISRRVKWGEDYEKIAQDLARRGNKVRIYEATTGVRGYYDFYILYKKK